MNPFKTLWEFWVPPPVVPTTLEEVTLRLTRRLATLQWELVEARCDLLEATATVDTLAEEIELIEGVVGKGEG